MASAWTCNVGNPGCTLSNGFVTAEGFIYDSRGNQTSYYQDSPTAGGWLYYWNGIDALGNLSYLGIHDLVTLTAASWDGEGRITSLTASAGTAPFTSATYGPFGPTAITYGSGDTDSYSYDNVGHVYNYQFNVGTGGQNYNGSLYWSANGTLRHLLTTNTVTGVNTTVNGSQIQYAYDDLGRLSAAGDVVNNTMNQSFSYDAYGNNTKSGSPNSWNPPYGGYDPATNRYKTGGSCSSGIAYDTDGNLLCDTFHAYTWDAEARLSSVDGKTLTRDAFGRVVESQTWGSIYEVLHTPVGDMWYSGQTSAWGSVQLPGGGSAKYNAGSLQAFNHPDWAGSSRLSTNTSRTLASSTEYAPFGEDYNHGTSVSNFDFAFNGGSKMDMFLGMYDTLARELHPVQGRWIQPDPAGLAAVDPSSPQTWNRYAYVANNPVSATDPSGLRMNPVCYLDNSCGGGGGWSPPGDSGAGVDACGIDPFCGSIGPFGSPVAHVLPDGEGGWTVGSWVTSTYAGGGNFIFTTTAPKGQININCVGVETSMDCALAGYTNWLVINDGSHRINPMYPGLAPGDVPAGSLAQGIFPGNPLWRNANGAMNDLAIVYAATPAVLAAPEVGVAVSATAESYGIPVTAWSIWTIRNWNSLMNLNKMTNWVYAQCQTYGPC